MKDDTKIDKISSDLMYPRKFFKTKVRSDFCSHLLIRVCWVLSCNELDVRWVRRERSRFQQLTIHWNWRLQLNLIWWVNIGNSFLTRWMCTKVRYIRRKLLKHTEKTNSNSRQTKYRYRNDLFSNWVETDFSCREGVRTSSKADRFTSIRVES